MQTNSNVLKIFNHFVAIGLLSAFFSCTTSGPITTVQDDSQYEIVSSPKDFSSPLAQIESARKHVLKFENGIKSGKFTFTKDWLTYSSVAQGWDELEDEQSQLEQELAATGEVVLFSGRSYSFDLESYCVHGGQAQPVMGDELKTASLRGPAENWLPTILTAQGKLRLPQEKVQYLIWALLNDVRFDELTNDHQNTLIQFYPDAAIRFGNRRMEEIGKDVIKSVLQPDISGAIDQISEYRQRILDLSGDYRKLEEVLAPRSERKTPMPVGWMKMPDSYLMRLTSDNYRKIRVDIYVPPEEEQQGRSPQAAKRFRPSEWIGLPAQGQRLAISTRAVFRDKRKAEITCDKLKKWRPKKCDAMSDEGRSLVLAAADPKNFKHSRYSRPPKNRANPEEEADCSSFVNEIFHRAGFDYQYAPTVNLRCLSVFHEIPNDTAKPGDLILYPGHVGILDKQGLVISATVGGAAHRSMRSPNAPGFLPSVSRLSRDEAGNGEQKILRWSCP